MVTRRGETIDRIIGLEMGADDYLGKPFHLRELLARVKSLMRRAASSPVDMPQPDLLEARFAGWHIDRRARTLLSPAGENVRLTRAEFDLLVAFIENANQVLSRDRLLDSRRAIAKPGRSTARSMFKSAGSAASSTTTRGRLA